MAGETPGDYAETLNRLRARLGEMREATADPFEQLGPKSHPVADLMRLARHLGRGFSEPIPDEMPDGLPGPATINVAAEKLGFETLWETLSPEQLEAHDFPLVILLKDRSSRLALGFAGEGRLRLLGSEGEYQIEMQALSRLSTGTVFRVMGKASAETAPKAAPAAPAAQPVIAPPSAEPSASPAAPPRAEPMAVAEMLRLALKGQSRRILHLCIASFLINLIGMAMPLFSMAVFDRVIPHAAVETLWALALGVALALGLELMLRHARLKLFDAVGQNASFDLQGRVLGRLLFARLPEVPRAGGQVLPVAQELDQAALIAPQLLVSLAVDLPFFVLLMLFIASIGGPIVLAPLIGTALLVLIHAITHGTARRAHHEHIGESRRQMQHVLDAVSGAERIRLANAAPIMLSRWEETADRAGYAAHIGRYWHGMAAQAGAMVVQAVVVVTIVIGAFRVQDAAMTIGALSALILLVNRAMMPVSILTGLLFRAMQLGEGLGPARGLIEGNVERPGDLSATPDGAIRGKLDLHRVSFAYPGESRPVLREVSLSIAAGERIGIIGKAGCGKSSLLKLMTRLADPGDGRILLDEWDIRHFEPAALRRAVALMPQETALFDLSLHDNLVIGLPRLERAEFDRIVKLTGVQEIASQHPAGFSLMVGPGGARLSGGERQAVALARAMMGNPKLLLLDEPTAAMDNGMEARLIAELKKTATDPERFGLVIATHRLPMLALVDRVIWLDQGRVVADGPKEQVFAKLGLAA